MEVNNVRSYPTSNPIAINIQNNKCVKGSSKLPVDFTYALQNKLFDPFNQSPPNEFMNKLHIRYQQTLGLGINTQNE
jgi:hypothetical protein|tara:strand:+ start:3505 stop:3735 length:231 start_codon:yes stop_codon:yes gene_type:complete